MVARASHRIHAAFSATESASGRPPGVDALRAIVALNLLSTSVHYTHNFVMAQSYPVVFPFVNATAYRVAIVVFWPLLTAVGLWGLRLYRAGEIQRSRHMLAAYSVLGLTTLGHFFGGNPDIPPLFYATLFTDFLAGSALLAFAAWTFRQPDRGNVATR